MCSALKCNIAKLRFIIVSLVNQHLGSCKHSSVMWFTYCDTGQESHLKLISMVNIYGHRNCLLFAEYKQNCFQCSVSAYL